MAGGEYFLTYGWRGAWIVYENGHFRIKIVIIKQLVSRGTWGLVIVFVGYGSNNNRLRVYEKVDWLFCHSNLKHLPQRVHTNCNTPIFWDWVLRNQQLLALLSLSILRRSRKKLKQCQFLQGFLAHWFLDETWIG